MRVAALFVQRDGVYASASDVEIWDASRDARRYAGPFPVVAHPPCSRWCRLAGLVEARWGHKRGDDGGCFEAALHCVRSFGGVLEHPAYSDAWTAFDLLVPSRGGWKRSLFCGGWVSEVEQGRYGHPAKKATWLYACGIGSPPRLDWAATATATATVGWCRNRSWQGGDRPRLGKRDASRTPIAFRDVLLSIARAAQRQKAAQ